MDRIRHSRLQLDHSFHSARLYYNYLRFYVDMHVLNRLVSMAHALARRAAVRHEATLKRKLLKLWRESPWKRFSHETAIENKSSRILSSDERTLLGLGMSFNLEPSRKDTYTTVAAYDKFFQVTVKS